MKILRLDSAGTATNGGCKSSGRLIAAGPLTVQPCSMPFRYVLVQRACGGYLVGREEMFAENAVELIVGRGLKVYEEPMSSCLTETKGFGSEELAAATNHFGIVLAKSSACLHHPVEAIAA